eukprot:1155823-Pelagomonas_calceolata.AAC.3
MEKPCTSSSWSFSKDAHALVAKSKALHQLNGARKDTYAPAYWSQHGRKRESLLRTGGGQEDIHKSALIGTRKAPAPA